MATSIDTTELDAEINTAGTYEKRIKDKLRDNVRDTSERIKNGVKGRMPVDTGSAKARWGTPGAWQAPHIFGDGIWEVQDDGFSITQGARMSMFQTMEEYIAYLNQGTSQQAPAGFIDVEVEKGILQLVKDIAAGIEDAFK